MDKKKKKMKLSLPKKTNSQSKMQGITIPDNDFNETCEFRENDKVFQKKDVLGKAVKDKNKTSKKISKHDVDDKGVKTNVKSRCTLCLEDIKQDDMSSHLQTCLKAKFSRNGNKTVESRGTGEHSAQSETEDLKKEENPGPSKLRQKDCTKSKEMTQTLEVDVDTDCDFCQICQKDISKLNSQRKSQHLNRCIDQEEKKKKKEIDEEIALENAKSAILSCPMCGKPCKTENSRKTHLKKCAQSLNVPTEQMLKLVKNQEEEHQLNLAAGILPTVMRKTKTSKQLDYVGAGKKRKLKEPKNKLEEDTQMAMAISSSLSVGQEQSAFGQLKGAPTVNSGGTSKRGKKKKEHEEKPILLMLPDEEKQKRMENKVMTVLIPQDEDEEIENTPPNLQKSQLKEKYDADSKNFPGFWQRSTLLQQDIKEFNTKEMFYVKTLMPPVEESRVTTGSKVRRMSEIPGRRKSSFKKLDTETEDVDKNDKTAPEDIVVVSTQTAVILAELAAEAEESEDNGNNTDGINCSGFCPEKCYKVETTVQEKLTKSLKASLLLMIDNPAGSDLQIISLESRHDIHSCMVANRCPELMKMADDKIVHLEEYSSEVVLSVLKYIYAGDVVLTPSIFDSVVMLAERLNLTELIDVCHQIKNNVTMETFEGQGSEVERLGGATLERKSSEIDSLLKEIMDDSDEDDNKETESDSLNEYKNTENEEISCEDYYDILCTQRQKQVFDKDSANDKQQSDNDDLEIDKIDKHDGIENEIDNLEDNVKHDSDSDADNKEVDDNDNDESDYNYQNGRLKNDDNDNEVSVNDKTSNRTEHIVDGNRLKKDIFIDKQEMNVKLRCDQFDVRIRNNSDDDCVSEIDMQEIKNSNKLNDKDTLSQNSLFKVVKTKNREVRKAKESKLDKERVNSCVSPDVFSDIPEESLVYEDADVFVFSQSESDDSHINHLSDNEQQISSGNCEVVCNINNKHRNDSDEKCISDTSDKHINDSDSKLLNASDSHLNSAIHDMSDEVVENNEFKDNGLVNRKVNMSVNSIEESESVHTTDEAIIICSDDSNDGHNMERLLSSGDIDQSLCDNEYENENRLESTRIKSKTSNRNVDNSVLGVENKVNKEFSLIKSDFHNETLKSVTSNSPGRSRLKNNLNTSQASETGKSFSDTLNRRLDSSSADLFASPSPLRKAKPSESRRISNNSALSDESNVSSDTSKTEQVSECDIVKFSANNKKRKNAENGQNVSLKNESSLRNCEIKIMDDRLSSDEQEYDKMDSERMSQKLKPSRFKKRKTLDKGSSSSEDNNLSSPDCKRSKINKGSSSINVQNDTRTQEKEESPSSKNESDDIVITGDNFKELSQECGKSPTFKERKKFLFKKTKIFTNLGKSTNSEEENDAVNSTKSNNRVCSITPEMNSYNDDEPVKSVLNCENDDHELDDIWDGFDDCGVDGGIMACNVDTPIATKKLKSANSPEGEAGDSSLNHEKHEDNFIEHQDDSDCEKPQDDADLTEFGNDSFLWKDDNAPTEEDDNLDEEGVTMETKTGRNAKDHFRTPSVSSNIRDKKQWELPSPFTPIPDYDKMATPIIKKEVQKYGVRPVGKKRMIILLKDIYKQTHQYETDSDCEEVTEENKDMHDRCSGQSGQLNIEPKKRGLVRQNGQRKTGQKSKAVKMNLVEENAYDSSASDDLDLNNSQDSDGSDLIEESFMERKNDDDIPQSQLSNEKDLQRKLMDFLQKREDIKLRILVYEPLEFDWLRKEIKDAGIKCSEAKILEFLDEKCITFTMKNRRQERANKKRGPRKKKSNKETDNDKD